jgi:biotin operon repressor
MSHIEVVWVIVLAGVFGGTVNFALARTDSSGWKDWFWSVVIGLGASFLVPLFLNTISSTLLSGLLSSSLGKADIYIFAGFCLLGAIASKAMIQTLTQRVLREAQAARKEVETLKEEIAPIVEKETEDDAPVAEVLSRSSEIPENLSQVLKVLDSSRFSLRSVTGVAQDVGRSRDAVVAELRELSQKGLAVEVQGKKGLRWSLTPEGRKFL